MGKNITDVVREICLGMPETSEVISRGGSNFRVADDTLLTLSKIQYSLHLHSPFVVIPAWNLLGEVGHGGTLR